MLTFWIALKKFFFQLNYLHSNQWIWPRFCRLDCNSVWSRLSCCLSKGSLKRGFLEIYLIMFLRECNFKETSTMKVACFFWKCSKFKVDSTDPERNGDKVCCFCDNSVCIGCVILSLLGGEYFSSTVSVLTNSRKIFYSTKRGYFQLNYLHCVHKMSQRCCHPDCTCVLTRWPCCLSKGTLKQEFLDVCLITF